MKIFVLAAVAALGLAGAAQAAQIADRPVELSEVEVTADPNVKVTVTVSGDMGPSTVVDSDPASIHCGPFAFRYEPGPNRQCWMWVRRGRPLALVAKGMKGLVGRDWHVRWQGCEVTADGAGCTLAPEQTAEVAAVFTGTPAQ